ncbi:MAG: YraN family protein [Gammaproteobacteria bacterium]|nr:YraN family protein [Gammaproteobacteria bacterium]
MKIPNRSGPAAEAEARRFLETQGLVHRDSNYRSRFGEIDLVMDDQATVVFVEVRLRRNGRFGGAAASVSAAKQRKLLATAAIYLEQQRCGQRPARFDIVAFDGLGASPQWIRGAFQAS